MRPVVWKSMIIFLSWTLLWLLPGNAADEAAAEIYGDIFSHQEEYLMKKGDRLPTIAQRRALRLQVITKHNNLKNPNTVKPGMTLYINNTFILPNEVPHGLVVNLAELAVYHFQNGQFLRRYPLAAGKRDWETPTGNYKILNKIKNPTWRVPESIQEEMYYRGQEVITEVPPGPDNPLGTYWMATSARGVGFHATTSPWSVGSYASHGCFRMLPDQIEELFHQIEVGTPVKIMYKPIKLACTADNRIFLEVHADYYRRIPNKFNEVEALIKNRQLEALVDWDRVKKVIKDRDGIAIDITKTAAPTTTAAPHLGLRLYTGEIIEKSVDAAAVPANQRPDAKKKPQPGS